MLYVANANPGLLIENMKTMLSMLISRLGTQLGKMCGTDNRIEPGGYIQWEELDVEGMHVRSSKGSDAHPLCNKYITSALRLMKAQNVNAR